MSGIHERILKNAGIGSLLFEMLRRFNFVSYLSNIAPILYEAKFMCLSFCVKFISWKTCIHYENVGTWTQGLLFEYFPTVCTFNEIKDHVIYDDAVKCSGTSCAIDMSICSTWTSRKTSIRKNTLWKDKRKPYSESNIK